MNKKRNTRKNLIIWVVILSVLLAALLCVVLFGDRIDVDDSGEETSSVEETVRDLQISTKFGDHFYPGEWADQVRTEITEADIGGYVTYYGTVNGKEAVLFTVYYGKGSENSQPIGTMKVGGISMTVSVEKNDFQPDNSWTQEEIDVFHAMQEGLNDVIASLKKDPSFSATVAGTQPESTGPDEGTSTQESTVPEPVEDLIVSTPYGDLAFPGEWADQVRTEAGEVGIGYAVTFYGTVAETEQALFTVSFAADTETSIPVGVLTVDGISLDVSFALAQIETDSAWSQEEVDTISAMQECVNYVIEKLKENAGFEPL